MDLAEKNYLKAGDYKKALELNANFGRWKQLREVAKNHSQEPTQSIFENLAKKFEDQGEF